MKLFVFVAFVLGCFASPAFACSCIWPDDITVEGHANLTDIIFSGVYLGSKKSTLRGFSGKQRKGKFRVVEVLKGDVTDTALVHFQKWNGANCGMRFEKGIHYEVFATLDDNENISTDSCHGTRKKSSSPAWSWDDYRRAVDRRP